MDWEAGAALSSPAADDYSDNESIIASTNVEDIKFGYCSEMFIIHIHEDVTEEDIDHFRDKLCRLGDSVVVVHDSGIIKVHAHSNAPGKVIQFALCLGEIDKLKVDNMREQNRQITAKRKSEEKEQAVVAVSVGEGLDNDFKELGTTHLISGGQTMNPSIDVISQAINKVNARNVFVLPNNSNIILAAEQAAAISNRNVIVLPTKTVMQGIAAMTGFNPDFSVDENRVSMTESFTNIVSGAVTYAVRNTSYEGKTISEGDVIGLMDNNITVVAGDVHECALELVKKMIDSRPDSGFVSIYWGEGASQEAADALAAELGGLYPEHDFMVRQGDQPLYYYYISVE